MYKIGESVIVKTFTGDQLAVILEIIPPTYWGGEIMYRVSWVDDVVSGGMLKRNGRLF